MTNKSVLIVEDSTDTRAMYATALRHSGYQVYEAGDGLLGLQLAREKLPDLIVMNVAVPLLDGWSATRALKDDQRTAAIPVVAVTGFSRVENRDNARDAGCDAYLDKPCPPSRLVDEIQRWIGAANGR